MSILSQEQTNLSCSRRNLVSGCFSVGRRLTVKDMREFSWGSRLSYILFEDVCSMFEGMCSLYFGVTSKPSWVDTRILLTRIL